MASKQRAVVDRFLEAVHAMDADAVAACFAEDGTYQNVPHEPARGRDEVRALFARAFGRCERTRWDILNDAESDGRIWLERIDRFWMPAGERHIECNGIWEVDAGRGVITSVRDYLDMGVWLERSAS